MTDLTGRVLEQIGQPQIEAIARQFGIDPAQAGAAVQQALPLLMGGLARNSTSEQGAHALYSALERDHGSVDVGSLLGGVLGGGSGAGGGIGGLLGAVLGGGSGSRGSGGAGEAILGHIFGGRRDRAAEGLGRTTGLGGADAAQLLVMLAPIVMAVLGNMTRKQGLDANALGGLLGQERNRIEQGGIGGLLGSVLDRDGDGQVGLDEMLQAGAGLLGAFSKRP